MQEYPRALYMNADPEKESVIVHSQKEEQESRELGFAIYGEVVEPKRKPGRPPKAE